MTLTKKILIPMFTCSILVASPGGSIYNKSCKSCHGAKGEKIALGKSKAIKGMSVESLGQAMEAYISGERKSMSMVKKMKKDFVKKHSKKEIQAVYTYIHKL